MSLNLDSKQIDEKWLDSKETWWDEAYSKMYRLWDDYTPVPYSVRYWFHDKDIFHPTRIYRKVSNVVRWIPLLWDDVDWDYSSLYDVITFKLKNMREHHKEHHNHTDWNEVVDQMQTAEEALKRVREANYLEKLWGEHRTKYPRQEWIRLADGMLQLPPMSDAERADFTKLVDAEEKLRQDDLDTFASTFTKYSRGWWD